jgi:AmpD protein
LPSTAPRDPAFEAALQQPQPVELVRRPCSHYDDRPDPADISLLVIHNISLPPATFSTPYIDDFFGGRLDCTAHPYFARLQGVRVSAHCVIYRDGRIWQYVPFNKRAWHAGLSLFDGRDKCNDFSIGIELEGTDDVPYTEAQYSALASLSRQLLRQFPAINPQRIVGHCDIASGRKTDPGPAFNWPHYFQLLGMAPANSTHSDPSAGESL